jgi:ACS family hexuronate transporter-like MFS transporter
MINPATTDVSDKPASSMRWAMIALAFFATVINYLDRQAFSVAAPVLREQFQLSNVAYSRIVFAFLLAYTLMNGVSGIVIDRIGTRAGYALCMAWWSAAAILHAFCRGAWSFGVARFLLGMGEAGNWPAAVKVVAEWFSARERALASGIFNSGSSVGAILAPPLIAWVILLFGWQAAFLVVGFSGLLWLPVWWLVYSTPAGATESTANPHLPSGRLLRNRFVIVFTLAKVFLDPVWYFYIFWFPEYLKSARGFSMESIGKFAWIPFLLAGFGNLLGGWLAAFLIRRGVSLSSARKVSVTVFAFLMCSAIPAVLTPDVWQAIALVSVAMLGYTGCSANMLSFPSDVFPDNAVAAVYGFASMGSGFGGMVFTLLTGWLVDHVSYTPAFILFGILPLVCATLLWTTLGPITPASARAGPV